MTVERDLDLKWKIPSLVCGAPTEQLHADLATLEEQEKKEHLAEMDKFWGDYLAAVRQEIVRRDGSIPQVEGDNHRYGIEHCVIKASMAVSAEEILKTLQELGGSVQTGIGEELQVGEIYNFHIHTNEPEAVINYLRSLGEIQGEVIIEDNLAKAEAANVVKGLTQEKVVV